MNKLIWVVLLSLLRTLRKLQESLLCLGIPLVVIELPTCTNRIQHKKQIYTFELCQKYNLRVVFSSKRSSLLSKDEEGLGYQDFPDQCH